MRFRSQFAVQASGGVANAVLFVVLTPVMTHSLGLERYGVLLLVVGFTIYVGLAEFGLGVATSREIAAAETLERDAILGTSMALACLFGIIAGALFAVLAIPGIALRIGASVNIANEVGTAGPALFFLGLTTVMANTVQGALFGSARFLELNALNLATTTFSLLGPAGYAILVGNDIPGLIAIVGIGRAGAALGAFWLCYMAGLRPRWTGNAVIIRRLVGYGGWSTLIGILHRATNSIDRILLGAMSGAAAVPLFAVPQSALSRAQVFGAALMSAAFPRLAREEEDSTLASSCYRAALMLTPLYVAGIFVTHTFIYRWLGAIFAERSFRVAILLGVWAWLETMGNVPYVIMQARSRVRHETVISALIAIPNVALLVGGISLYGVEGAAVVAVIRSLTFLIARIFASGRAAAPTWDLVVNGAAIGAAATLAMLLDGWPLIAVGVNIVAGSVALSFFRRPRFVDEILAQSRDSLFG